MKYALEIELADNKSAFVEEFFSSVTFIKKAKKIPNEDTGIIPREHWAEAAKLMHQAGDDNLLMPETLDEEENFEWTWEE
jgi:hypothetical protein